MSQKPDFLSNSLLVVAHLDDETLWFNAIVKDVDEIAVVFKDFWADPLLGPSRVEAVNDFPHNNISLLGIDEAGAFNCANWDKPKINAYGMQLGSVAMYRELKRQAKRFVNLFMSQTSCVAPDSVGRLYQQNYTRIREKLLPKLTADMNVFTHNPWGEYGHEEHVQVFRVLDDLRQEIGFKLWMSNYCTKRSLPLAMRYLIKHPSPYIRLETDKELSQTVLDICQKTGCWTWPDDWQWFDDECYTQAPRAHMLNENAAFDQASYLSRLPLNFFKL